jgi:carbamoyl-phosphate synthase small subunit
MTGYLLLEDGSRFEGRGFGFKGTVLGEAVFQTAMVGYQEILTDPSYAGQLVVMTYPHMGNYGVNPQDVESRRPHLKGFLVRELSALPSNWRARGTLDSYLRENGVVGLQEVDTRALTRHLRSRGALKALLTNEDLPLERAQETLAAFEGIDEQDLTGAVSCRKAYAFRYEGGGEPPHFRETLAPGRVASGRLHVVAVDFGLKENILRNLLLRGCEVTVIPAYAAVRDLLALEPDGVFLSNGPGNPEMAAAALPLVRYAAEHYPTFGICFGHQLLALAFGGKTYKLPFGHRGANHPVLNLETGRVEITSQNHGFAVEEASLPRTFEPTHRSLNDGTLEGMRHRELNVFSVQYHPEASPGPHDSLYLFDEFVKRMEEKP